MNDPQKFFIGVIDFFSILLPGALLTFLLMDPLGPVVLGPERYTRLDGPSALAIFLFASYLLGHLVFLVGAWLDELYDWFRRYSLGGQIERVAAGGRVVPWPARALLWLVFRRERNLAVRLVQSVKLQALGSAEANAAINSFQWSKALLNIASPQSLAVVQRFEADSKFFRCLTVVLLVVLAAWGLQDRWPGAGAAVVAALLVMAFWRYLEQRHKATNQAYWAVITLMSREGTTVRDVAAPDTEGVSVVSLVFRLQRDTSQYLLVRPNAAGRTGWQLPSGQTEPGESEDEAAVRIALQSAGTWARPLPGGNVDIDVGTADGPVVCRLMEAVTRGHLRGGGERVWLGVEAAVAALSGADAQHLLRVAEQRRIAVTQPA